MMRKQRRKYFPQKKFSLQFNANESQVEPVLKSTKGSFEFNAQIRAEYADLTTI